MTDFVQGPDESMDRTFDWANMLVDSETISSAVWTASSGISTSAAATPISGAYTTRHIGPSTSSGSITCTVTTSLGNVYVRSRPVTIRSQ